ncbi:universal stress protein [uncultured Methanofollis sp.]|uniref:universal stress protein n=1 Tax=uncultured Methanofollis sp. TaxID=262500 RepID=UPI002615E11B|nr:universal stress protein [uncultured Methanofollis sp.]
MLINPDCIIDEITMGYFNSLLQRKFKDVAGKRYETIARDYREFLLTEEETVVPEVLSILMPLDYFVKEIPPQLYETLSSYERAKVTLVYIVDMEVIRIVADSLDEKAIAEFRRKREAFGEDLLNRVITSLEGAGLTVTSRMFAGEKFDNILELMKGYDLIAVSKKYGTLTTEIAPLSSVTLKLAQMARVPIIVY